MNFLAHLFLSGDDPEIAIGNFIADAVKGKAYNGYPDRIKQGILLHRAIDSYTDSHPIVLTSTKRLHPTYHKYSGVIVDIYYDHFLAKNWTEFHHRNLSEFVEDAYALLSANLSTMPERSQYMLPYMIKHNWLEGYAEMEGIRSVLGGMARRTKFESGMENATNELQEFYLEFESEFREFLPQVIAHSEEFMANPDGLGVE